MTPHGIIAFGLFCLAAAADSGSALAQASVGVGFAVSDEAGTPLPCRIYVFDKDGMAHRPEGAPFWEDGFVCEGSAVVKVPPGDFSYVIERGPEWAAARGSFAVAAGDEAAKVEETLGRLADLKGEGWFAGDLHVHRAPDEVPLHLEAEDLSIASVQTWWNQRNPWAGLPLPAPVRELPGDRFYHVLGGEDERGGGALLFHRMAKPIDITQAEREWPPSVRFLHEADAAGAWVEIEKPFWWDTAAWLATGKIDSLGIAQNHMNRRGVFENEAWGRPRDREAFPGIHGNGRYTQDIYYKILDAGFRVPPSAGSASGVLKNPVGYNRVYVRCEAPLTWDKWWDGLAAGRSFVTNGPLLRLTANGAFPGAVLKSDGALRVQIEGNLDSRDRIKAVELVRNGTIEAVRLPFEFEMSRSGWFLVRAIADVGETFRFASTAPWYAEIAGVPMKLRPEAAGFFLNWAKERRRLVEEAVTDPLRRMEATAPHEAAIRFWEERAGPQ